MSILKLQNVQKNFGSVSVLADFSFSLERGQKAALVGLNGTGKTTLLKIIAGIEKEDAGTIAIAEATCIGYLPQDISVEAKQSIINYLRTSSGIEDLEREMANLKSGPQSRVTVAKYNKIESEYKHRNGYSFLHKAQAILVGFGLGHVAIDTPVCNLSSGQKSKVALAGILLKGVDLLLLDEPTNNLDLPALIWLEDFLRKSDAACIVVSHDRRFLDKIIRKIFEIHWFERTMSETGGTYSDYLLMEQKRLAGQKEAFKLQQEEIKRLTASARDKYIDAEMGSRWQPNDNDKMLRDFKREQSAHSSKTGKAIEKRIEHMEKIEKPEERKPFEIPLEAHAKSNTLDIRLSKIVAGYEHLFSLKPISIEIPYGNRVGIIGLNGSGKSTLLKTITGRQKPLAGKLYIGSGIRFGNLMQEHETLSAEMTPLELFMERAPDIKQNPFVKLTKFGFSERHIKSPISALSPGGRARLLLALFSAQAVNILVLDEPTNHLDLEALDALEETLRTYTGTVILVSHDRYFLEKALLGTVYNLEGGELKKIPDLRLYIREAEENALNIIRQLELHS
jgi:ATP-binding cassette subfamily F protein 3